MTANEQELTDKLDADIDDYVKQMEQALEQGTGTSASYVPVSLAAGQTLQLAAGSEVLLRSGEVKVASGTSPVLLDATTGSSLEVGGSPTVNHLYVAPLDGVQLSAASAAVLLVRGTYTVA